MSAAAAQTAPPAPPIYEVLAGEMGAKYGALPVVPLPQEDELLISFVHSMGEHLKTKGIYRRDRVIVIPNEERVRLDEMEPEMFCSWSQSFVVTSKIRHDKNGEPFSVYKDMPTEAAKKVLVSTHFYPYLSAIDEVHTVPLPKCDAEWNVELMPPGFDSGIFTFPVQE